MIIQLNQFYGEAKICRFCAREEKEGELKAIYKLLAEKPWLDYGQIKGALKHVEGEGFSKIKRAIKVSILDQLVTGKKDLSNERWEKLFCHYAELVLGKKASEIDDKNQKGVRQAVQNRINNYYRGRKLR